MKKRIVVFVASSSIIAMLVAAYYVYRLNRVFEFANATGQVESYPDVCFELSNNKKMIRIKIVDKHSVSESRHSLLFESDFGKHIYSSPVLIGKSYAKKINENKIGIYLCPGNPEIEMIQWEGLTISFLPFNAPSDATGRIDTVAMEEMIRRDGLIQLN